MLRHRVIDVFNGAPTFRKAADERDGLSQLFARLEELTADRHDPSDVLLIGNDAQCVDFLHLYKDQFTGDAPAYEASNRRFVHLPDTIAPDGEPVCHFLANEQLTLSYARAINSWSSQQQIQSIVRALDKSKDDQLTRALVTAITGCKNGETFDLLQFQERRFRAVVVLHPSAAEGHERYLAELLSRTSVTVYAYEPVGKNEDGRTNGLLPRTQVEGFDDLIPADVDFEAAQVASEDDEQIPILPSAAMYGRAGELARMLRTPIGFAYPAVLATLALFVKNTSSIRATLYVGLLGRIHSGKTLTTSRVRELFGIDRNGIRKDWCVSQTPASDRGLIKLFPGPVAPRLLALDEMRSMMSKGGIENSTLISTLCELWSLDYAGAIDKQHNNEAQVRLSILGNLKVDNPSEFPSVFTHATSHGLYDRFLFGVPDGEKWRWSDWRCDPLNDVVSPEVSEPQLTNAVLTLKNTWEDGGKDRERLAELALRVALITSAINKDTEVTVEAFRSALCLMEWQEKIRSMFQPAEGANEHEECVRTIEKAFEDAPGHALHLRDTATKRNWYRRFARTFSSVKKNMEAEGRIKKHKETGLHYWTTDLKKEK